MAAPASYESVACPNCERRVAFGVLNEHLDKCLAGGEARDEKKSDARGEKRTANDADLPPRTDVAPSEGRARPPRDALELSKPFAERMRPRSLGEYIGQAEVVKGALQALLRRGQVPSMVLWGPPGSGKTTLARLVTREATAALTRENPSAAPYRFVEMSATVATVVEMKKVMDEAVHRLQLTGQRSVLFIDEIQRLNRTQQDVFLPALEKGHLTLLAATTENPSFRLQSALLSRMRVVVLSKLSVPDTILVLRQAMGRVQDDGDVIPPWLDDALLEWIAQISDGDARAALNALELALVTGDEKASHEANVAQLKAALKRTALKYARCTYVAPLTQKSIRGSNPDAALYWLARMVAAGDDPLFIARRLIVCASEDCCSPEMLNLALATYRACEVVGLPECGINLSHCVATLAEHPKSTRTYRAWKKALSMVESEFNYPVPLHIRNAPTSLMKNLGYGAEYRYEPSFAHPVHQEFFPPEVRTTRFLSPPPDAAEVEQVMERAAGTGVYACQRQFQIGARAVDFDLLDEWERKHNDGAPWRGRAALEAAAPPAPGHPS